MVSRRPWRLVLTLPLRTRYFSVSTSRHDRAIVYTQNGNPTDVLGVLSCAPPGVPPPNSVNIRFLMAPINPSDINVVEGVYPSKPTTTDSLAASGRGSKDEPVFVGGNEGLAKVTAVGEGVEGLQVNDWVIMNKPQAGTWTTSKNMAASDVLRLPNADSLTEVHGATMMVNPPSAWNMLHDYVDLKEGDWVIQNGANSSVGQAVIQIAAARGVKTINFVRNRENLSALVNQLENLGATKVLTYEDLEDKGLRKTVKEWTSGKEIRLALNGVGGKSTAQMAQLLGQKAHMVTYGGMSKQPLSFSTSMFIFKDLTAHGFWQTRWVSGRSQAGKIAVLERLTTLAVEGKLREPEHEVIRIEESLSDEQAGERVRNIFAQIAKGEIGKKVLLRLD